MEWACGFLLGVLLVGLLWFWEHRKSTHFCMVFGHPPIGRSDHKDVRETSEGIVRDNIEVARKALEKVIDDCQVFSHLTSQQALDHQVEKECRKAFQAAIDRQQNRLNRILELAQYFDYPIPQDARIAGAKRQIAEAKAK